MDIFEKMKSAIAIFLLLLYLGSTTEMHELLKMPLLIDHFIEHRSESAGLSFWDFISLHYGQGEVRPPDYDKDMKLPFKSTPEITCTASLIALIPDLQSGEITHHPENARQRVSQKDHILSDDFPSCIWQPPKTC